MDATASVLRAAAMPKRHINASLGVLIRSFLASILVLGFGPAASIGQAFEPGPGAVMVGPGGPMRFPPDPAVAAALRTAIDDKIAKLDIKSSSIETNAAKASRARHAIKESDFATARQIIVEVLAASKMQAWRFYPFDSFMACFACSYDQKLGRQLDEWVAKSPKDAIPLLMRADYYFDAGWSKRGQRMVQETPESQIESF